VAVERCGSASGRCVSVRSSRIDSVIGGKPGPRALGPDIGRDDVSRVGAFARTDTLRCAPRAARRAWPRRGRTSATLSKHGATARETATRARTAAAHGPRWPRFAWSKDIGAPADHPAAPRRWPGSVGSYVHRHRAVSGSARHEERASMAEPARRARHARLRARQAGPHPGFRCRPALNPEQKRRLGDLTAAKLSRTPAHGGLGRSARSGACNALRHDQRIGQSSLHLGPL